MVVLTNVSDGSIGTKTGQLFVEAARGCVEPFLLVNLLPHPQLPPVIQNMAFQKYSNMEQSLFTRFVRLGVPTVQLDAQGRARPALCELYQWRYRSLGNLPHVMESPEFQVANPGFFFDYQLVNVEDFNGVGETEPTPYFYQVCGSHGNSLG